MKDSLDKGEFNNQEYNKLFEQNMKIFNALKNKEPIDIDDIIENDDQYLLTKATNKNNNAKVDLEAKFNLKKQAEELFANKNTTGHSNEKAKCKISQEDGSEYEGELLNGKYHGKGIFK